MGFLQSLRKPMLIFKSPGPINQASRCVRRATGTCKQSRTAGHAWSTRP